MGVFSGLDQFGLGKLEKVHVFEEENSKVGKDGNSIQKWFVPVR